MATILHISADVPDAFAAGKTAAVRNLLALAPDHTHIVYSINRINGIGGAITRLPDPTCVCLTYRAPPFGTLLRPHLDRLADWIADDLVRTGPRIDAIHAHKLAVEGLIAQRIAKRLSVPFAVSLWGNTDQRFVAHKPGLRSAYRRVAQAARVITPAAPWIARALAASLQFDPARCIPLPIVTAGDAILRSSPAGPRVLTAFNLDFYRPKGAPRLIAALARVNAGRTAPVTLDIAGGGSAKSTAALERAIATSGQSAHIRLLGPVAHGEMQQQMTRYAAFALPTLSETFGMVYVEALLAGVPILYSRDRGIDGYFDNLDIGYRCDPGSVDDIAAGLAALVDGEASFKAAVSAAQQSHALDGFRRPAIAATYARVIDRLLAPDDSSAARA